MAPRTRARARVAIISLVVPVGGCSEIVGVDPWPDAGPSASASSTGSGMAAGGGGAGGGPPVCGALDVDEGFGGASPTSLWTTFDTGEASVMAADGQVTVQLNDSGRQSAAGVETVDRFDVRGCVIDVDVLGVPIAELGAFMFVELTTDEAAMSLVLEANTFYLEDWTAAGGPVKHEGEPYVPLEDVAWRMKIGDQVTVETSSGLGRWVVQMVAPFDVSPAWSSAARFRLGAGTYMPVVDPGQAVFDAIRTSALDP